MLDLEDSVPAERKGEAREGATEILNDLPASPPQVWVRINSLSSPWGEDDAAALSSLPVDGVRLPRAEDPRHVVLLAHHVGCPVQLLVETARGLMSARELAEAHPSVAGIALGEADLAADLRVTGAGLDWARGWIVAIARAVGLPSPVQSVYTDVADLAGLRATTAVGRDQGFFGRSVIHPTQISPVHEVYRPGGEETRRAKEVVSAFEEARERGESAVLTPDGRFVDPAVVARAQLTLELAGLDEPSLPVQSTNEENR